MDNHIKVWSLREHQHVLAASDAWRGGGAGGRAFPTGHVTMPVFSTEVRGQAGGVLVAMWWFSRKTGRHWLSVMDFVAPLVPLGLAAGRLGNFINAELWGRVTDVSWGMIFRNGGPLPRHPSQLYEMMAEGLLLFVLLWFYSAKPRPRGAVSGLFLIGYGFGRFACEFTREPDDFLGLLALGMSMGQWLSAPMIAAGLAMVSWAYRKDAKA